MNRQKNGERRWPGARKWFRAAALTLAVLLAGCGTNTQEEARSSALAAAVSSAPVPEPTEPPAPTDAPTPEPEPEQPALSGADAILVWVPVHGGTKYHSDPGCSNMKDPRQVTQQQAMAEGFAPCKKCYG